MEFHSLFMDRAAVRAYHVMSCHLFIYYQVGHAWLGCLMKQPSCDCLSLSGCRILKSQCPIPSQLNWVRNRKTVKLSVGKKTTTTGFDTGRICANIEFVEGKATSHMHI